MAITYAQNVGLVKMPPQVEIGGITYRVKEINGLIWITEELKNLVGSSYDRQERNGVIYYNASIWGSIDSILPSGWRRATEADYNNLITYYSGNIQKMCSTNGWDNLGTNESTLGFEQIGYYRHASEGGFDRLNQNIHVLDQYSSRSLIIEISGSSVVASFGNIGHYYSPSCTAIRVCRNA